MLLPKKNYTKAAMGPEQKPSVKPEKPPEESPDKPITQEELEQKILEIFDEEPQTVGS